MSSSQKSSLADEEVNTWTPKKKTHQDARKEHGNIFSS